MSEDVDGNEFLVENQDMTGGGGKEQTRGGQIMAAFLKFHEANPAVWELFERFSLEAVASGISRYSSVAICQRIRWFTEIETRGGRGVKINNNFTAYYARLFSVRHPEHADFFKTRKRFSENKKPHVRDVEVWDSGAPGDEDDELRGALEGI